LPDWVVSRGDVFDVRLDKPEKTAETSPTIAVNPEGSEQQGQRPAVVVTRETINASSPVVSVVVITKFRGKKLYPSHVFIKAPEGGLDVDSVAKCEQVRPLDKSRIVARRGKLPLTTMRSIDDALRIALALDP
jgi:mRNA interferase MazF